jgi:DNA modification methylase
MSVTILCGDCRDVLQQMPDGSVHCVVTSPPYWGLRDYQLAGQIGLEPTPDAYVATMVEVFHEVRRVLRKDGTLWLNLGDSYAADGGFFANAPSNVNGNKQSTNRGSRHQARKPTDGLKPKDLCGIPWRVAFALQADGWWLRQDIIWSKPNPMPESVTDRCTKAHEYLFLLTKSERYFYDAEAIKEAAADSVIARANYKVGGINRDASRNDGDIGSRQSFSDFANGRNKRSVWEIATSPFPEAHFATFPPALIEPCIKAGTSERGCCAKCGAPWVRQVEKPDFTDQPKRKTSKDAHLRNGDRTSAGQAWQEWRNANPDRQLGWAPSCKCDAPTVPCTVLDPFGGAGTTGLVGDRLQRNAILIELNPEYAAMMRRRIENDAPLFAHVNDYDATDDFARSIEEAYRVIRERKANGGKGWGGWE